MPMDGFTLHFLARELREALVGARVDRAVQPERDEVLLTMRNHNENFNVLFSASAGCARAHITRVKKNNPLEPPMLCMLLRKHLSGARVTDVRQIDCDRILEIAFEHFDELGERTTKTLVCEFMGKHSNLIFLTADGKIIDSARHVTEQISSVRQVLPGTVLPAPTRSRQAALPRAGACRVGRPSGGSAQDAAQGPERMRERAFHADCAGKSPTARSAMKAPPRDRLRPKPWRKRWCASCRKCWANSPPRSSTRRARTRPSTPCPSPSKAAPTSIAAPCPA